MAHSPCPWCVAHSDHMHDVRDGPMPSGTCSVALEMANPGGSPDATYERFASWQECARYWQAGYLHASRFAQDALMDRGRIREQTERALDVSHLTSRIKELEKRCERAVKDKCSLGSSLAAAELRYVGAQRLAIRDVLSSLRCYLETVASKDTPGNP